MAGVTSCNGSRPYSFSTADRFSLSTCSSLDSRSDITIRGAELFAKVVVTARLHKRDFKKADRIPKRYDQRTFSLDGRLDLDIEFDGKLSLNTPVGIISCHRDVHLFKQLVKDPHSVRARSEGLEAQVPQVRVHLVQTVSMLPHQSIRVTSLVPRSTEILGMRLGSNVRLDGNYGKRDNLMAGLLVNYLKQLARS